MSENDKKDMAEKVAEENRNYEEQAGGVRGDEWYDGEEDAGDEGAGEVSDVNEDVDDAAAEGGDDTGEVEGVDLSRSDDSFSEDYSPTLEAVIEAILFATDEPLSEKRLVDIAEVGSVKQIRECVGNLNGHYESSGRAFRIEQIAGGYQMMTLGPFNHWLKKMLRVRTDNKLSQAALETLAIIAYKQPIMRADVEAIRGVAAGEMIRSLMYKGLVKIVGRAEVLGRPMLYGTTRKFLDVFGLGSLKDLPTVEQLQRPEG
jgi:segregation and condensation protein B